MATRGAAAAAVAAADKENVAPAVGAATRSTRRKGLGNVQPQQPPEEGSGGGSSSLVKKPTAAAVAHSQQQLPRLLLFTEKAEEVFMLSPGLPEAKERGELAKAVMEDRGNPAVWWRLLQHVGRVFGEPDRCDAKLAPQIRKLYQKATRIIPEALYKEQGQSPALVNIWLGFAAAERRVSESDAKEAYEHMARCGIGAKTAGFYLHYAAFEEGCGRTDAAISILTQGLNRGAAPADALRAHLARVKGEGPPPSSSSSPSASDPAAAATKASPGGAAGGLDFDLEGIDLDLTSVKSSSSSGSSSQPPQQPSPVQRPAAEMGSPASTVSSSTSSSSSSSSASPPKPPPPPPASVTKGPKPAAPAADAPSSTKKAPPPTPKQTTQQEPPPTPSTDTKGAKPAAATEAPRTASKPKRLVPTGRLLGLGRAERVRPAAEPKEKPKEEGTGSTTEGAAGAPAPAERSSSAAPAPAPAPPSTPRPAATATSGVAPPSLGRLQPITEDDGTGSGKGSEDTVGAGGGLRASLPPAARGEGEGSSTETRDLSVRLQQRRTDDHVIARTPAAKSSSSSSITVPGSAARTGTTSSSGSTAMPPPSARPRASPTEPQQQQQQQQQHQHQHQQQQQQQQLSMHSQQAYALAAQEDLTHTRDRGRRAMTMAAAAAAEGKLTADGGQRRQHGSLSEEEHSLTRLPPAAAARALPPQEQHQQHEAVAVVAAVPLSASKPRGGAAAPPAEPAPAAPQAAAAAAAAPAPAPAPPQSSASSFSFEALLASRNFMALNGTQYLRLDVLGRGGSSKVFRVLSDSGQVYALKRVRVPPKDARALESFANEITLLGRLRGHPCIIQLVDSHVCRQTGLVLMLMELGEIDLNKLIAQSAAEEAVPTTPGTGWRLSLNFIRFVWEQMLRAVQCVHAERIVHGDLKPANFVFVKGRLKLIDFGIAKALGNDTTNIMRESQVGTVNYMSPEAILDTGGGREQPGGGRRAPCMKIGRASDVWSLGCILYQLVYGKTPFAELNLIQKLHCIVDDGYRIPFPNAETLHHDVIDTIRQCLRRDPTQRPPIAGGAGSLLEHPFLRSGTIAPAAAAASMSEGVRRSVVEATLAVVDRDPAMLRLEGPARVGAVSERVLGELRGGEVEEGEAAAEEVAAAPAAAPALARKEGAGVVEAADHTGDSSGSSTGGYPNTGSFN